LLLALTIDRRKREARRMMVTGGCRRVAVDCKEGRRNEMMAGGVGGVWLENGDEGRR
jgi:hypothetical protein